MMRKSCRDCGRFFTDECRFQNVCSFCQQADATAHEGNAGRAISPSDNQRLQQEAFAVKAKVHESVNYGRLIVCPICDSTTWLRRLST